MKLEWPSVRIGDVAEVFDGPHATPKKTSEGPLFLGINCLDNGRLNTANAEHLSEEDFAKWTRRVTPREGDVVFSYETRLGEAAIIPAGLRCCLGRRMALVRTDSTKLDPTFFLYQYLSPDYQSFLHSRTIQGSTVDRLALKEFPDFTIKLPPLDIQRSISKTLSLIDNKIELNRRMNQTLEQLAQTLFKQWFVAFDFPISDVDSAQEMLQKKLAPMLLGGGVKFPEIIGLYRGYRSGGGELVESELGEIPKGWRVGSLDTIATYLNGLALQRFPADGPDSLPVIKIREMRQGITDASDRASRAVGEKYTIQDGDVLFSWSGTLDVVLWSGGEGALNQHLFKVSSPDYPKWFYYLWTLYHLEQFKQIAKDKATTMGHIQRRHLTEAKVIIPDTRTLQTMHRIAEPLLSQQLNNMLQSRTLATLRDTLLPQLLSGRLTVRQAAELVG